MRKGERKVPRSGSSYSHEWTSVMPIVLALRFQCSLNVVLSWCGGMLLVVVGEGGVLAMLWVQVEGIKLRVLGALHHCPR